MLFSFIYNVVITEGGGAEPSLGPVMMTSAWSSIVPLCVCVCVCVCVCDPVMIMVLLTPY